ncbi:MAG TPA: NUDIX hydrolase [Nitrososphaerales archaeon]|nr:NUDIX hydrolase [Nitrososphaerales archaeon]
MSSPKMARLVPQPEGTQPEEMVHISSFAFIKKGGKMVLVRRTKPERWAGKWCIPGAVLYYGEDPAAGAKRLVMEQLGAAAKKVQLADVQSYGDRHWDICFVYDVEIDGLGKLGADFEKADYFDPGKLPPETRDDHKEVVDVARSRKAI